MEIKLPSGKSVKITTYDVVDRKKKQKTNALDCNIMQEIIIEKCTQCGANIKIKDLIL